MPSPYPFFPFYAADWVTDTAGMSIAARGAYISLLCYQWINRRIPNDIGVLCRASGSMGMDEFEKVWPEIKDKFPGADNPNQRFLTNKRLEKERAKAEEISEKNRANARKRWGGNATADATGDANSMPNECYSHSQSHSQEKKKKAASPPLPPGLNLDAWGRWMSYRTEIKKPWKPMTIKARAAMLAEYTHEEQAKIIDHSISNGYQGLFPESALKGSKEQLSGPERVRRAAARVGE